MRRSGLALVLAVLFAASVLAQSERPPVRRTPEGVPDLSGTYDVATLTPLERPKELADQLFITREQAEQLTVAAREVSETALAPTDPDREAPPEGGAALLGFEGERRQAGEELGAGNVGGYNWFWVDPGDSAFSIDGRYRSSILTDPPDGRQPPRTPEAAAAYETFMSAELFNDGTAWWLEKDRGPYDDIEDRPLYERCLLGFSEGPPMLPSLYNNTVRVVQTADHLMILNEMIHDARIVRIGDAHGDGAERHWLGESVGRWEGDTLVIETKNFRDQTGLPMASRELHLVERLTPLDGERLQYAFTVTDPKTWTASWSGDYVWPLTDDKLYEYACHEGNYSFEGIMRGARLLEQEASESSD